jgi:tetratricopeptide (TPR) repeat protein
VILSFAADWQLSGASTVWLHVTNVLLHALVAALVVFVLAAYVSGNGALAGGIVFALHPVHVEAVANLVGRAELMAACGLLGAVLVARAVRRRRAVGRASWPLEIALIACVALALLSKEHAAIALVLLWLDDRARPAEPGRLPLRDFVGVALTTAIWLAARYLVERGASFANVAPAFIHVGAVGRLSTMLPVVFVVIRLMVWPWELSHDYGPRVIDRLEHPTLIGIAGLAVLAALAILAVLLWRRHRPAALGILIAGLAWLPTSNLFFPSGIVLSERTLYSVSIGLALLAALAADALMRRAGPRAGLLALAMVSVPLAVRSWTRGSVWRGSRELRVTGLLTHPEAYAQHQAAAHALWLLGRRDDALREYENASELYPYDPFLQFTIATLALRAGHARQALRHATFAQRLDSDYTVLKESLATTLIKDARRVLQARPLDVRAASALAAAYASRGQRDSALGVWRSFARHGGSPVGRWVLEATTCRDLGLADSARIALDSAAEHLPAGASGAGRVGLPTRSRGGPAPPPRPRP